MSKTDQLLIVVSILEGKNTVIFLSTNLQYQLLVWDNSTCVLLYTTNLLLIIIQYVARPTLSIVSAVSVKARDCNFCQGTTFGPFITVKGKKQPKIQSLIYDFKVSVLWFRAYKTERLNTSPWSLRY